MTGKQRKPFLKFRPEVWLNDERLALCSPGAHGLWINMIARMHLSEEYGVLIIDGKPPSLEDMATLFRWSSDLIAPLLGELKARRVIRVREHDNALYSERMMRDFEAGELGREHVAKRWNTTGNEDYETPNRGANKDPNTKSPESRYKTPPKPPKQKRGQSADGETAASITADFMPEDDWIKRKAELTGLSVREVRAVVIESRAYWRTRTDKPSRKTPRGWLQAIGNRVAEVAADPRQRAKLKFIDVPDGESSPAADVQTDLPEWFTKLEFRFVDSDEERTWKTLWSRCIPVEDGNPIVLRAPSRAAFQAATQANDLVRFERIVGRGVSVLPPENISRHSSSR